MKKHTQYLRALKDVEEIGSVVDFGVAEKEMMLLIKWENFIKLRSKE